MSETEVLTQHETQVADDGNVRLRAEVVPLRPADRADCCGPSSRALVEIRMSDDKPLLFCGHHFRKHFEMSPGLLEKIGATIVQDIRLDPTVNIT